MHCKFLKIKAFAKYINGNTNGFMAEKLTNTFKKIYILVLCSCLKHHNLV